MHSVILEDRPADVGQRSALAHEDRATVTRSAAAAAASRASVSGAETADASLAFHTDHRFSTTSAAAAEATLPGVGAAEGTGPASAAAAKVTAGAASAREITDAATAAAAEATAESSLSSDHERTQSTTAASRKRSARATVTPRRNTGAATAAATGWSSRAPVEASRVAAITAGNGATSAENDSTVLTIEQEATTATAPPGAAISSRTGTPAASGTGELIDVGRTPCAEEPATAAAAHACGAAGSEESAATCTGINGGRATRCAETAAAAAARGAAGSVARSTVAADCGVGLERNGVESHVGRRVDEQPGAGAETAAPAAATVAAVSALRHRIADADVLDLHIDRGLTVTDEEAAVPGRVDWRVVPANGHVDSDDRQLGSERDLGERVVNFDGVWSAGRGIRLQYRPIQRTGHGFVAVPDSDLKRIGMRHADAPADNEHPPRAASAGPTRSAKHLLTSPRQTRPVRSGTFQCRRALPLRHFVGDRRAGGKRKTATTLGMRS
ncbi:MAG: hypothetical protein JNG90_02385 [Planctomycetaceae bacterium]|nr:hypothetical protein [Planctomycetaceae bacterium]